MTQGLSQTDDEYYARQIVLLELGAQGQQRLRSSKALVVGLGGLGSVVALNLAQAGIGHLRLVDQDTVEYHNLHRQALYTTKDLRYPKAEIAERRLREVNSGVHVEAIAENLRPSTVSALVDGMDCVVDGLDNMRTRYLLNRECVRRGIPFVYGGGIGLEGNVTVFHPPRTPCLECVFPGVDDAQLPTCDTRGVLGATTTVVGAVEALEAIKLLAGITGGLLGRLLVLDLRTMEFTMVDLTRRAECPVCQRPQPAAAMGEESLAWLCGADTVNVNPPHKLPLDLSTAGNQLQRRFEVLLASPRILVIALPRGVEVSIFPDGRMLIKNVRDEQAALQIQRNLLNQLSPT